MSDTKKPAETSPDQDLADLANNVAKQRNAFAEDEMNTQSSSRLDEADQSLGALHTGNQSQHEEVVLAREAGAPEHEDSARQENDLEENPDVVALDASNNGPDDAGSIQNDLADLAASELREEDREVEDLALSPSDLLNETRFGFEEDNGGPENINTRPEQPAEEAVQNQLQADDDPEAIDNGAPEKVALDSQTISEDAAIGDVVGQVSAIDPEGDTLTFSLSDDAGGMFTIDPDSGEIKLAGGLDFESTENYSVTVDVSDGENITQQTFTINVGDVNEVVHSVALDNNAIAEDASVGDVVGTVSAVDPEGGALSYSLSDDAGGVFTIDPNSGEIKLAGGLDFESTENYSVTVDVSDGENVTQQTFTINVGDVNEAAHSVALDNNAIAEDASVGDVVGTVSAVDPEGGTLSYSFSDDAGGMFTIDPNSGEIKLAGGLDFETTENYTVTVDVSDGVNITQQTFTINVGDVNEAVHSVALDNNAIAEDASVGDVVGTVSAVDPEGGALSYSLSDNAGGMFTIDPDSGEIKLAGGLDFETTENYSVTVDVSDGVNVTQQTFTINVGDVNEAAHSVALDDNSVNESANIGDVVGVVSAVDPENESLSYSFSDDAGGLFTIDPNTGEIKVAGALDYETTTSYNVTVDVSDGVNTTTETFTINIDDNLSPVLSGGGNSIEIQEAGEVVDLSNMDMFPDLHTSGDAEQRIGTELFEEMVSDSENLTINYQSSVTVTFQGEIAGYRNSIGAYQISNDGTITGADLLWGDASSDKLEAGVSQATYDGIESGSTLGFFVIADGFGKLPGESYTGDGNSFPSEGNWMFVSPDFDPNTQNPADHLYNINTDNGVPKLIFVDGDGDIHTQSGNVYHSTNQEEFNPDSNEDMREHFIAGVDQENGVLNFGFEDLYNGGDHDFNDGMFSAEIDVRDLMEAPNPLFSRDADGNSSFEIEDLDSSELQQVVVTVTDIQDGDTLSLSGPYKIVDGMVQTYDGQETGIAISIDTVGDTTTLSLSGDGDLDHYEAIVQNINFSNTSGSYDIAGDRSITVVATDSDGEVSEPLETVFSIAVDEAVHTIELSNYSIVEDAESGTYLGTVTSIDPEGRELSYTLSDTAGGRFEIDTSTGEIWMTGELDYDAANSHNITVGVSDGVNTTYQMFEINVIETMDGSAGENIIGTVHADVLTGTEEADFIDGLNGDDVIYGRGGDDTIEGDNQEDLVYGGTGDDVIDGGRQDDTLYGESGNDSIDGGFQNDLIYGGSGQDTIDGGKHDDTIYAGSDDDYIFASEGDDVVYGEAGNDIFEFGLGDGLDSFSGGDGGGWSDTIVLSDGMPSGDIGDWLTLTSGTVESTADGEIFLSEDAAGTITLDDNAVLTFEGVEKIEG
ncbi:cadherin domain-containing protein [Sneathiella limimaris]|uniref:cadherin domain-containing protein n=1 Tax=Sneathiella limimaris TaxID=1964213 RepID=UPI00146A1965|nr:cadherin domain-containing protein [Sneathiella limimaris]